MNRLTVLLALGALVPVLVPAKADALTLAQRVTKLEGEAQVPAQVPVIEYDDFAAYGDPVDGLNAAKTYDTLSPTDTPDTDN